MRREQGISLIALIITIIVIIILAAIVIGGIFNTPAQAKFSRWCDEIGRLQDAVMAAHGSRTAQVATDVNSDRVDNSKIYKYIATGNEEAETEIINRREMVKIDKNNNKLNMELPEYENQDWYIKLSTGEVYMVPGLEYEGAPYTRQLDVKLGGGETLPPIDTTGAVSYVGCYADIDGNGTIDGVIYADLLAQSGQSGSWGDWHGTFTISTGVTTDNVKDYVIGQSGATDSRFENKNSDSTTYIPRNVIRPVKGTDGEDRFYVMGLNNLNGGTSFYWYVNKSGSKPLVTSGNFGTGRTNTATMIRKWESNEYGTTSTKDVWQYIMNDWFLPSRGEWAAFGYAFNISGSQTDSNYYGNFGLSNFYWTSSQYSAGLVDNNHMYYIYKFGGMAINSSSNSYTARLSTTF